MVKGLSMLASFAGGMAQRALNERDRKNKIKDAVELQKQLAPITLEMFEKQQQIEFPYKKQLKGMEIEANVAKAAAVREAKKENKEKLSVLGIDGLFPKFEGIVEGKTAEERVNNIINIYQKGLSPVLKMLQNKTVTVEEIQEKMEKNGDWAPLVNNVLSAYNNYQNNTRQAVGGTKDIVAPISIRFGPMTPLIKQILFKAREENVKPEYKAISSAFRKTHNYPIQQSMAYVQNLEQLGVSPKLFVQNLSNTSFFNEANRYLEGSIDYKQFIKNSKTMLGMGSSTDAEVGNMIGELTTAIQKRQSRDPDGVLLPSSFKRVATNQENANQRHQSMENLAQGAEDVMEILLTGDPSVTDFASTINRGLGNLVSGGREIIKTYFTDNMTVAAQKNAREDLTAQTIESINATGISVEAKENIINNIKSRDEDLTKIRKQLEDDSISFEDRKRLEDTYMYHMKKLYLTFAYSKFIQGGAGGNAVSNADFANTANSLFGTFSTNNEENKSIIARGMANLHYSLQNQLLQSNLDKNYQSVVDSKGPVHVASAVIQKLGKDRLNELSKYKNNPEVYYQLINNRDISNILQRQQNEVRQKTTNTLSASDNASLNTTQDTPQTTNVPVNSPNRFLELNNTSNETTQSNASLEESELENPPPSVQDAPDDSIINIFRQPEE